jgi:tetratricopeptide (TPR) repeat protein
MLIGRERLQFMEAAYGQLPERLQEALQSYLRYGNYREIAHYLGISEENARKRIQEARAILRRRLAEYDANRVRSVHIPPRRAAALPARTSSTVVRAVTRRLGGQKSERVYVTLTAAAPAADARRRHMLQEYVARHPSGWKRHLDLARVLIELDVPETAALHYRAAALRKPARGDIWIDAMSVCVALGRLVDASVLRDLVMESPLPEAERALLTGLAAVTLGHAELARTHFETARQLAKHAPRPRVELARLSLAEGAVSDALALLDEALGLAPDDVAALTTGLGALRAAGRGDDAIERARRALAIDPLTPIPD